MTRKIVALLSLALVALGVVYLVHDKKETREVPPAQDSGGGVRAARQMRGRTRRSVRTSSQVRLKTDKVGAKVAKPSAPPKLELLIDDETEIDEELRHVINELQVALDGSKRGKVLELVQALLHRAYGGVTGKAGAVGAIPKWVKLTAVKSLGWFGSSALPEIAGFLVDESPEVVQAALEQYELALMDFSLGDRDRSLIVTSAAKVINDVDSMNILLFELNNMRHSVAVEAMKTMMVEGSAATKEALPDNIQFYTGEEGINTPEKLDEWLADHPDDEYDEDFYGGIK